MQETTTSPGALAPDQCPICAAGKAPVRYRRAGGETYHQCGDCGLVFIANGSPENPYPVNALSSEARRGGFCSDFRSNKLWNYAKGHVEWILGYLGHFPLPDRPSALSVGCAYGHDLAELARRGWDVLGVDHDESFAERARNQHGIEIRTGFFERLELKGQWDLVLLASVLPYLSDIDAVMSRVRSLTRPGGFVFITVRNVDWNDLDEILGYPMNVHARQYFPASALRRLCSAYGFNPVALDAFTLRLPLAARLAGKLPKGRLKAWAEAAGNAQFLAWNALGRDCFVPSTVRTGAQVRFLARRQG